MADAPQTFSFGKYEVLDRLGMGGMAEVFRCRLAGIGGFDKTVVVKRMLPNLLGDQEFVAMFLDEARLTALLSHPQIVQIYEIDQIDGVPYIAMEYVRGPTLAKLLRVAWQKQAPCGAIAAKIMADISGALNYAHNLEDADGHRLGVIHRDVSPNNIVVSTSGVAKLLDFGVAKATGRLSQTVGGAIKGKFRFMAPEQFSERSADLVDHRVDVFAAGACLYLGATGQHAYNGSSDAAVLSAAAHGEFPTPSSVNPDIDPELERIILWAMAPSLSERCPNARALQDALEAYNSKGAERITDYTVSNFITSLFGEGSQRFRPEGTDLISSKKFFVSSSSGQLVAPSIAPVVVSARASPPPPLRVGSASPVAETRASPALVVTPPSVEEDGVDIDMAPELTSPGHPPPSAPPVPRLAAPAPGPALAPTRAMTPAPAQAPRRWPLFAAAATALVGLLGLAFFAGRGASGAEAPPALRPAARVEPVPQPKVAEPGPSASPDEVVPAEPVADDPPVAAPIAVAAAPKRSAPTPPAKPAAKPAPAAAARKAPAATPTASRAPEPAKEPTVVAAAEPVAQARPVEDKPRTAEPVVEKPAPAVAATPAAATTPTPTPAAPEPVRPAPASPSPDGPISECPEGAQLAGAAPPSGSALWCQLPGGVRHGKFVRWFSNGKKSEAGEYVNGKKNGRWVEYYESGAERERTDWRRGVKQW